MARCGRKTEVYSRVCGYFRPVANWNKGKLEEFRQRKTFKNPEIKNGHEVTTKPASQEEK